jgi:hypothetical protein
VQLTHLVSNTSSPVLGAPLGKLFLNSWPNFNHVAVIKSAKQQCCTNAAITITFKIWLLSLQLLSGVFSLFYKIELLVDL